MECADMNASNSQPARRHFLQSSLGLVAANGLILPTKPKV